MSANLSDYLRPFLRTALTGGGANALDGIATVNLTVPVNALVTDGTYSYVYQLQTSTAATSAPTAIRPTDYNGATNTKVWILQAMNAAGLSLPDATNSTKGVIELAGDLSGTAAGPVVNGASASFYLSGVITPTALASGTTNNWNPTGLSGAGVIRCAVDALSGSTITGIQGTANGRVLVIQVISGAGGLTLNHNDSGSTAGNRILCPTGSPTQIPTNSCGILWYDPTSAAWRLIALYNGNWVSLANDLGGTVTAPTVQQVSGKLLLAGVISPAQITFDQNDYNPTGRTTSLVWRINSDAKRTVTGIASATNQLVLVINVGSNPIVLSNQNASSSASNRFDIGRDFQLNASESAWLWFDATTSRWRLMGSGLLQLAGGTLTGRLTLAAVSNTQATLSYSATVNIDWTGAPCQLITLTGNLTLTDSNITAGAMQKIILTADASGPYTLTFPSWGKVMGAALPINIAANKTVVVSLEATGTTDASVIATAVAQV